MKKTLIALAALTISGVASAASVDNVAVGFTDVEDFQGITVGVEKSITESVYVGANLQALEHVDHADVTAQDYSAKVGALHALSATHNLYGEVGVGHVVLEDADSKVSDDYASLEVGVKGDLSQKAPIQYSAFVGSKAYSDLDNTYYVGADMDYAVTDTFAVGVGYKFEAYDSNDQSLYGEENESQFFVQTKFKF
ncbi:outer membrane insertion C-terminal signal domain protein [Vibrio parahaemolyticus VPCR-2010]|uniref:outer membrane beta-barrel protein n=1 Tax=Vibrio parahaemolyticus TaxID=670 RepID=UPI00038E6572|nr:outer membrane insertion C-terminal signal domain protein [Vibrio parahaemolyticus VPCR-2010]